MKAKKITLHFNNGKKFQISQNDWECAPDPICTQLVDDESFKKVAKRIENEINGSSWQGISFDNFLDTVWSEYENAIIQLCRVFYYEDMTDEEFDIYRNAESEEEKDAAAEKVYNRISNENNVKP